MGIANPRPAMRRKETRHISQNLRAHAVIMAELTRGPFAMSHEKASFEAAKRLRTMTRREIVGFLKGHFYNES